MIIMEMDSDSQAFHALNCAILRCGWKLRIALDEGEFKIKADEETWSAELKGATLKIQGQQYELLRDLKQTPATREPYNPDSLEPEPQPWESYGLYLGELLTDWPDPKAPPTGLWRVEPLGLLDLAGGDDWDWQGLISNGGLGTLQKLTPAASHA